MATEVRADRSVDIETGENRNTQESQEVWRREHTLQRWLTTVP